MPSLMMMPPDTTLAAGIRLGVAALLGLAVGLEREWSGHSEGPNGRFAGLRTFTLLGLLGGVAGLLVSADAAAAATAILAGVGTLTVAAFVMAVRRPGAELDGTTEAAALVVAALGVLAGGGHLALAAGSVAVVVFMLGEKQWLHGLVAKIDRAEMRAAIQFAVLALVVLPLFPGTAYPWLGGLSPRDLWAVVLLLSGINFVGSVARRVLGAERGYVVTGLIGGLVSSTLVTLQYARRSRAEEGERDALARGVLAACSVLTLRVFGLAALLSPPVALAVVPYLVPPLVVGLFLLLPAYRAGGPRESGTESPTSPLGLLAAVRMTALFVSALAASVWLMAAWGSRGVMATAVVFGISDVDALTVSMARLGLAGGATTLAAQGIAVGILTNTVVKGGLAAVIGTGAFRRRALMGLGLMAASIVVVLLIRP
jgi:uncharacterized membrane protein (DUF4010 family)